MSESYKTDHDLIIELKTIVLGLRDDMKRASDTFDKLTDDHEKRIRMLEQSEDKNETVRKLVYGAVTLILIAFMGAITFFFIPKVAHSSDTSSPNTNATR